MRCIAAQLAIHEFDDDDEDGIKASFRGTFVREPPDENIKRLLADKLRILANSHYSLVDRNDVTANAKCKK